MNLPEFISSKISYYMHPLMFVNISAWVVNFYVYKSPILAMVNPIILLLYLSPGIFYIKNQKKRNNGLYNRTNAFIIILGGFFIAIMTYILQKTPSIIIQDAVIAFIVVSVTMLINRQWWNISFHASIPMCCAALLLPVSLVSSAICAMLALIVGWSRLPLQQHTLLQVAAGWLFGFGLTLALLSATAQI